MKVLLIIAAVFFLIGCIPVSVLFRYHDRIELQLKILFIRIGILPKKPLSRKKREKAEAKKAAKAAKKAEEKKKQKKKQQAQSLIAKPKPAAETPPKPKKPLTDKIAELIPWAKLGAKFVGEFFHRKLAVTRLRILAVPAGGDPAKTARRVGTAWEIIGVALPILERAFRIKERHIAVYPDFTASKTRLEAELCVRLRVGGVVLLALKYAGKALKLYLRRRRAAKRQAPAAAAEESKEQTEPNQSNESNETKSDAKVVSES